MRLHKLLRTSFNAQQSVDELPYSGVINMAFQHRAHAACATNFSFRANHEWFMKLPRDLDIFPFEPAAKPMCIQNIGPGVSAVGAIATGQLRFMVWESQINRSTMDIKHLTRCFADIANNSICQPGRPGTRMLREKPMNGSLVFMVSKAQKSVGFFLIGSKLQRGAPANSFRRAVAWTIGRNPPLSLHQQHMITRSWRVHVSISCSSRVSSSSCGLWARGSTVGSEPRAAYLCGLPRWCAGDISSDRYASFAARAFYLSRHRDCCGHRVT